MRHADAVEINRFIQKTSPYQILVKSEAGKYKAVDIFSRYMLYWIDTLQKEIEKTILMLDLDNKLLENELVRLEEKMTCKRVGEPICLESNTIKKTNSIYLIENKVKIKCNGKQIGRPFYLVLFASSLEAELNKIDPSNDTPIEDKISRFVEKKDIQDVFSLVFS